MFRLIFLLTALGLSTMPPARAASDAMNQAPGFGIYVILP